MASQIKPTNYQREPDGRIRTTFSDGTEIIVKDSGTGYNLVTDSGQLTAFRPAQYVKPQGFIQRIQNAWSGFVSLPKQNQTSEQGAASASSPVTYYLTLWEQRLGRRARIEDCRSLYLSDPRVFKSVNMYVDEALRGGPKIRVRGTNRRAKTAQAIADDVAKVYNPALIMEWGRGLAVEGDLFIQHVIAETPTGKELVQAVAMPAIGMERLTDDADNFINPNAAFEQIDSMTFETVAQFPSALMTHCRWNKINGDRYGTSEICTVRRAIRALELCEQAITISRLNRAPLRRHHKIGTSENTGSLQEINDYKAQNGFYSGNNEAYNPQSVLVDYFSNGNVSIETLQGDPYAGQIEDVKYLQNVLMTSLPTPGPFFGLAIEDAKRDVLEDMRKLWVRSHQKLQLSLDEVVRHGYELALTLAGIDPTTIEYTVQWAMPSLDTMPEVVDALAQAKEAGIVSPRTAVEQIAPFLGISDIDIELDEIMDEQSKLHDMEVEKRGTSVTPKDQLEDAGLKAEKKPSKARQKRNPIPDENED